MPVSNQLRNPRVVFFLETIHIPLWLLKDLCWLMTYRTFGVVMAIPTVLVALLMVYVTYGDKDRFLPNISIAFWILANASWMLDEFFVLGIRSYCLYPFVAGIFVFLIYLLLKLMKTKEVI